MRSWILAFSVLALYLLHQDFWFWRDRTLVFGVLPIGLFYHALYCIACSGLMWGLVKFAWPDELSTGTGTGTER
ncbi:MAG TPA: DUF3311 domain-containing protein [Vicinamibacterales bacterium]